MNKKVRNATVTKKGKKTFRSKLELFTYNELKSNKIPFQYEEIRFEIMPSFDFKPVSLEKKKSRGRVILKEESKKVRAATYLPDFVNINEGWIIEVKGLRTEAFNLRWKLFKKYLVDNKLFYDLYMPGNQAQVKEVIKIIKRKYDR
jgi:hypothetical protein